MFDPKSGLEVTIHPFGSEDSYHKWKAPSNSALYARDRNECYIEAVTGERFGIRIVAHPVFSWRSQSCLGVDYILDDTIVISRVWVDDIKARPTSKITQSWDLDSYDRYYDKETRETALSFEQVAIGKYLFSSIRSTA